MWPRLTGIACLVWMLHRVEGVLPTAQIEVYVSSTDLTSPALTLLASHADFGPLSPLAPRKGKSEETPRNIRVPPEANPLLCTDPASIVSGGSHANSRYANSVLLVPRGECTYQRKALSAQKMGASAVIVYNTMTSRYTLNQTISKPHYNLEDVLWPMEFVDYDCQKASAMVPTVDLSFEPLPYNANHNNPLLSGATKDNLCQLYSDQPTQSFSQACPSQRCLVAPYPNQTSFWTGKTTRACCAWDLHIEMGADWAMRNETKVTIPSVFITMQQGDDLLNLLSSNPRVVLSTRWFSEYNISFVLIWMLGIAVAALAAYWSADEYHVAIQKEQEKLRRQGENTNDGRRSRRRADRPPPSQEETLELEPIHALGFVIMASTSLFVLFYFKIYGVVKVFYAIGCSNAVVQVVVQPIIYRLFSRLGVKNTLLWHSDDFGIMTQWDLVATIIGYAWGMAWLYMAFFVLHPDTYIFYWVTQDILGASMCIVFLGLIQLNSIQVATILLIVAFVYDIFFVFITPVFFDKSIMVTVATSGGPPRADPSWCEKYPYDDDCQGGDPMPMLLTVPRFFDYQGGSSLLGLGDIVLPGLLLSFAARLDAAKSLVAIVSGGRRGPTSTVEECQESGRACCAFRSRAYFCPLVVAYAVGLLMANVAVYVMRIGQPALLYLVPCTLGTMSFLGWRRQELHTLWKGPRVLGTADDIVNGRPPRSTTEDDSDQAEEAAGEGNEDADIEGANAEHSDEDDAPLLGNGGTTAATATNPDHD